MTGVDKQGLHSTQLHSVREIPACKQLLPFLPYIYQSIYLFILHSHL